MPELSVFLILVTFPNKSVSCVHKNKKITFMFLICTSTFQTS